MHDQPDCSCLFHGTARCTCQYIVLLAYEEAGSAPPAVLTAHECDNLTRLHVAAGQPGERLSWPLLAALDETLTRVAADT